MSITSKQERRAEAAMRMVTGLGGLLAVSLMMVAMPTKGAATSAASPVPGAPHDQ